MSFPRRLGNIIAMLRNVLGESRASPGISGNGLARVGIWR